MKKGLLSLLAVVLTVVGCQNYDDQFAALNKDIAAINTAIAGLATVSADVSALKTTISGIQSGVTANGAASSALSSALTAAQTDIDAIEAAVAGVANAADLLAVSNALTAVQADVKEILAANSVINQDVTINSVATLEYAESLISTKTDAPTVIVNGNVVVTTGAAVFTAAELERVNLVTAKMATVLKDLTVSNTATPVATTVDFGALTFVDQSVDLTGATATPKLKTITTNLTVTNAGAVDYSGVTNIGGTVTIGGADVTSLNLAGVTIGGAINTTGSGAGILVLPKATTINVGTAAVTSLNATLGTDIDLGNTGTLASLSVTAPVATQIDILAKVVTGAFTLSTGTPTLVFANSVSQAGATTVNGVAQFHATSLTSTNGASTIDAEIVNLPVWAGTGSATMAMGGAHTTGVRDGVLTSGLILPSAVMGNEFTVAAAKIIEVKSTTAALLTAAAIENLTITDLADTTDFITDAGFATLKTLSVNGVADAAPSDTTQTNSVGVTSAAAALTDLTVSGTVHDVYGVGATLLKNVTLTGAIGDITMATLAKLESLAIGTTHIEGASASVVSVTGNAILTSVKPTSMSEVKGITISANPKLTEIDFTALTAIPDGTVTVAVTLATNALSASYVNYVPASETAAAVETIIKSNDLYSLKAYIEANAAKYAASLANTPTLALDIAAVTVGTSAAASLTTVIAAEAGAGHTIAGTLDTLAELALVTTE